MVLTPSRRAGLPARAGSLASGRLADAPDAPPSPHPRKRDRANPGWSGLSAARNTECKNTDRLWGVRISPSCDRDGASLDRPGACPSPGAYRSPGAHRPRPRLHHYPQAARLSDPAHRCDWPCCDQRGGRPSCSNDVAHSPSHGSPLVLAHRASPPHGPVRPAGAGVEPRPPRHRHRSSTGRCHRVHRGWSGRLRRIGGRNPRGRHRAPRRRAAFDVPAGRIDAPCRQRGVRRRAHRLDRAVASRFRRALRRTLPPPRGARTVRLHRSARNPPATHSRAQTAHEPIDLAGRYSGSSDLGCACANVARRRSTDTWVYRWVVSSEA